MLWLYWLWNDGVVRCKAAVQEVLSGGCVQKVRGGGCVQAYTPLPHIKLENSKAVLIDRSGYKVVVLQGTD